MIYLACPYSHPDPRVRELRFQAANSAAAKIFRPGRLCFSPISHSHPICKVNGADGSWAAWEEFDKRVIRDLCTEVWVLVIPGHNRSVGVEAEIVYANQIGVPVKLLEPEGYVPPEVLAELKRLWGEQAVRSRQ